jgi:hypothetical protein
MCRHVMCARELVVYAYAPTSPWSLLRAVLPDSEPRSVQTRGGENQCGALSVGGRTKRAY